MGRLRHRIVHGCRQHHRRHGDRGRQRDRLQAPKWASSLSRGVGHRQLRPGQLDPRQRRPRHRPGRRRRDAERLPRRPARAEQLAELPGAHRRPTPAPARSSIGTLNSTPDTTFTHRLLRQRRRPTRPGYGEGQRWLGSPPSRPTRPATPRFNVAGLAASASRRGDQHATADRPGRAPRSSRWMSGRPARRRPASPASSSPTSTTTARSTSASRASPASRSP